VVLEVVLAAWEELDQPRRDSILDLHRKFFAAVARQYRGVSLYSLNYDPLVPVALRPLGYDTGFLSSGHLRPGSCPTDARRLAQLHGSVGFVPGGACAVRWFDDFREARAQRIKKVVGERLVCTGNTLQPPFSAYYQRFFRDCYEAATLVFIGVGCGGEQLNTLLAVFPVLRPEQRVVVVCLQSGPETRNFTTFGDSFLFKIASATNDAFRQGVRTDIEKLATSVDERGFGQFTKQTWLYARGSEEFYRSGTGSGLL